MTWPKLVNPPRRAVRARLLLALLIPTMLIAGSPTASAFLNGDVLVSVPDGKVQQHEPDGTYVATLTLDVLHLGPPGGSAFDGAGNLIVTTQENGGVFRFDPSGAPLGTFGGPHANPLAVVVDAIENLYVAQAAYDAGLLKVDATGAQVAVYPVEIDGGWVNGLDLAADQCTLLYTTGILRILRYDVCTSTQLSDFATLPAGEALAVRILSDGGALTAAGTVVYRLDAGGNVVMTYDTPDEDAWVALALDPDGTTFWGADRSTGEVVRFDIATAAVVSSFNPSGGLAGAYGLSVAGDPKVAKRHALALTPDSAQAAAGTTATVTAHATESGTDVAAATILLSVTGQHSEFRSRSTDSTGRATFSYQGYDAGADTITACADLNSSAGCDAGEPRATATRTWTVADGAAATPPPAPPPAPGPPLAAVPVTPPADIGPVELCAPSAEALRLIPSRVTSATTPGRDRVRPHTFVTKGKVVPPAECAAGPKAVVCTGVVTVRVKRTGPFTISSRRARLRPDCTYRSQVTFRVAGRLGSGSLRVHAAFEGNRLLAPANAGAHTVIARP